MSLPLEERYELLREAFLGILARQGGSRHLSLRVAEVEGKWGHAIYLERAALAEDGQSYNFSSVAVSYTDPILDTRREAEMCALYDLVHKYKLWLAEDITEETK